MSASNPLWTPALPAELVDSILVFVDSTADLLSVCLANSFLRNVAVRHLYRSIRLRRCLPTIQLCHALLSQPALALYVVSLKLTFGNVPDWHIRQWTPNPIFKRTFAPAYFRLVFRAIKAMKNLKDHTFFDISSFIRLPSENLGRSLPGLKRITFSAGSNIDVALEHLSSLDELVVTEVFDGSLGRLSSKALPHLRRVRCDKMHLPFILPHRQVEHVHISGFLTLQSILDYAPSMSKSRCPLKSLELAVARLGRDTFEALSDWLPELEELVIYDFEHAPFLDQILRHQDTLSAMGNFRCLVRLCCYSSSYISRGQNYFTIVMGLGRVCPTLSELRIIDPRMTRLSTGQARRVYSFTLDSTLAGSQWRYQTYDVPDTERVGELW